jgi:hypothetical protein
MATMITETVDDILAGWLQSPETAGWDSPAGPLFLGGRFAESDIVMDTSSAAAVSAGNTGCAQCTGSVCRGLRILCA